MGIPIRQGPHRRDNIVVDIRDDPDLPQIDANRRQFPGEVMHVRVTRPTRENLVSDHQHRRRWV